MKERNGKEFWVGWAFMYRKYGMSRLASVESFGNLYSV